MQQPEPAARQLEPAGHPADLSALGPSAPSERIVAIDVLRGFALLGILLMNIRSFAMVEAIYFNPYAAGPLSRVDLAVWWLGEVLANSKFMTIFSMLFGAGIVMMHQRRTAAQLPAARVHYRRMLGLWIIGMLHAYLIWHGDILVAYALTGCVVYLFRRWRPRWLFGLGITLLLIGTAINLFSYATLPYWPAEVRENLREDMLQPPAEQIAAEVDIYRGPWTGQLVHRALVSADGQTFVFAIWGFWRVAGVMLLGMGLYKLDVLTGRAARRIYIGLIAAALLVGLPLVLLGAWAYPPSQRGRLESFFLGSLPNYWGSIPMALGYTAVIALLCQNGPPRWMQPLAAVGRTALSNYLLQSLICTLLFHGHGLGLFGRVSWLGQMGVVVLIWAVQLVLSTLYLRRFRMGPVETAWRALTYWRWPRRHPAAD